MGIPDISTLANARFKGGVTKAKMCEWAGLSSTDPIGNEFTNDIRDAIQRYIPPNMGVRSNMDFYRRATHHLWAKWITRTDLPGLPTQRDRELWFERLRVGYAGTLATRTRAESSVIRLQPPSNVDEYFDAGRPPASTSTSVPAPKPASASTASKTAIPQPSAKDSTARGATSTTSAIGAGSSRQSLAPTTKLDRLPTRSKSREQSTVPLGPQDVPAQSIEDPSSTIGGMIHNKSSESKISTDRQSSIVQLSATQKIDWDMIIGEVNVEHLGLRDLEQSVVSFPLKLAMDDNMKEVVYDKLLEVINLAIVETSEDPDYKIDWKQYKVCLTLPGQDDFFVAGRLALAVAMIKWQRTQLDSLRLTIAPRGVKRQQSRSPSQKPNELKKLRTDEVTEDTPPADGGNVPVSAADAAPPALPDLDDVEMRDTIQDVLNREAEKNRGDSSLDVGESDHERSSLTHSVSPELNSNDESRNSGRHGSTEGHASDPPESPRAAGQDKDEDEEIADSDDDKLPQNSVAKPDRDNDDADATDKDSPPPLTAVQQLTAVIDSAKDGFHTLTEEQFNAVADFTDTDTKDNEKSDLTQELRDLLNIEAEADDGEGSGSASSTNKITECWSIDKYNELLEFCKKKPFTVWNRNASLPFPGSDSCGTKPYQLLAIIDLIQRLDKNGAAILMDMAGYGKTYTVFSLIAHSVQLLHQQQAVLIENVKAKKDSSFKRRHLNPSDDHTGKDCGLFPTQCWCKKDGLARRLGDSLQNGPTVIVCEKTNMQDPWINAYKNIFNKQDGSKNEIKLIIWHEESLRSQKGNKSDFELTPEDANALASQQSADWKDDVEEQWELENTVKGRKQQVTETRTVCKGSLENHWKSSNLVILTTPRSFDSFLEKWAKQYQYAKSQFRPARVIIDEAHKAISFDAKTAYGIIADLTQAEPAFSGVEMVQPDVIALTATPWSHNVIVEMRRAFLESVLRTNTPNDFWTPSKEHPGAETWNEEALEKMLDCAKKYESHIKANTDASHALATSLEPEYVADVIQFMEEFCIGRGPDTQMFLQPIARVPKLITIERNLAFSDELAQMANDPMAMLHEEAKEEFESRLKAWHRSTPAQKKRIKKPELTAITKQKGHKSPLVRVASSFPHVATIAKKHREDVQQYLANGSPDEIRYRRKPLSQLSAEDKEQMLKLEMTIDETVRWGWHSNPKLSPYYKHRDLLMESPKAKEMRQILMKMKSTRFPEFTPDGSSITSENKRDKMIALSEVPVGALIMFIVLQEFVTPGSKHYVGEQMDIKCFVGNNETIKDRNEYVDRLNERDTNETRYQHLRPRIMVGTTGQLGTGINLQNVRYMVVLEPPGNLKLKRQIPYRIVRVGSHGERFAYWLHNTSSTWETLLLERHLRYEDVLKKVNEGRDPLLENGPDDKDGNDGNKKGENTVDEGKQCEDYVSEEESEGESLRDDDGVQA